MFHRGRGLPPLDRDRCDKSQGLTFRSFFFFFSRSFSLCFFSFFLGFLLFFSKADTSSFSGDLEGSAFLCFWMGSFSLSAKGLSKSMSRAL